MCCLAGRDVDGGGEKEEEEDDDEGGGDQEEHEEDDGYDDDDEDDSGEDDEEVNKRDDGKTNDEGEDSYVVSQAIDQKVAKKRADVLQAQIHNKLESIPELGLSEDGAPNKELIEYLAASLARLSVENGMLKEALQNAKQNHPAGGGVGVVARAPVTENTDRQDNFSDESHSEVPVCKEVHLVWCAGSKASYFRDVPRMFKGDLKSDHLRGRHGLENMNTYLKKHRKIAFVIVHGYTCFCDGGINYYRLVGYKDGKMLNDSQPAEAEMKYLVCNQNIKSAIKEIAKAHPHVFEGWEMARLSKTSPEPHFLYYTHHKAFVELAESSSLSEFDSQSIKLICDWVCENSKQDWDEAEELFKRGKVTAKHLNKLFRPGELVVRRAKESPGTTWVYKVDDYPWPPNTVSLWIWTFNGRFHKTRHILTLSQMSTQSGSVVGAEDGEVDITSLRTFPLRFSEPGLYDKLLARGNRFWSCRKKKIVSYRNPDLDGEDGNPGVRPHPSSFSRWFRG